MKITEWHSSSFKTSFHQTLNQFFFENLSLTSWQFIETIWQSSDEHAQLFCVGKNGQAIISENFLFFVFELCDV